MKSIRAGGIVINYKKQIALANEHLWGFPRGGVEQDESLIEAAKREILEEIGISEKHLSLKKKLGKYERYPNGVNKDTPGAYHMEIHLFLFTTEYTGDLIPQDQQVKETKWIEIEKVKDILTDNVDREFFEKHLETIQKAIS